jgi:hypothetical protein
MNLFLKYEAILGAFMFLTSGLLYKTFYGCNYHRIVVSASALVIGDLHPSLIFAINGNFQPGASVIKLFTAIIYCHSMVI